MKDRLILMLALVLIRIWHITGRHQWRAIAHVGFDPIQIDVQCLICDMTAHPAARAMVLGNLRHDEEFLAALRTFDHWRDEMI